MSKNISFLLQDFAQMDAIQAEYLAGKAHTQQQECTLPGQQIAAAATAAMPQHPYEHPENVWAAQSAACDVPAPSATTACIARPTDCDQHRPALAQLVLGTGSRVPAVGKQQLLPTAYAAAPAARHTAPATTPQPANGVVCATAAAVATADDDYSSQLIAQADDSSPTLIDVDTTTGGIQLHRSGSNQGHLQLLTSCT